MLWNVDVPGCEFVYVIFYMISSSFICELIITWALITVESFVKVYMCRRLLFRVLTLFVIILNNTDVWKTKSWFGNFQSMVSKLILIRCPQELRRISEVQMCTSKVEYEYTKFHTNFVIMHKLFPNCNWLLLPSNAIFCRNFKKNKTNPCQFQIEAKYFFHKMYSWWMSCANIFQFSLSA